METLCSDSQSIVCPSRSLLFGEAELMETSPVAPYTNSNNLCKTSIICRGAQLCAPTVFVTFFFLIGIKLLMVRCPMRQRTLLEIEGEKK